MYLMMPFNIKSETVANDLEIKDITDSSKLLVPGKVISSTVIPQGSLSMPIRPDSLHGKSPRVQVY